MKTININSAPVSIVLFILNQDLVKESWAKPAINALTNFITDNWKEITYERLSEINLKSTHYNSAEEVCRVRKVKNLVDLYSTHIVLPCEKGKNGVNGGIVLVDREALGQKKNAKFKIRKVKADAEADLKAKIDQMVEGIVTGKFRHSTRQPLTYDCLCSSRNMPCFAKIVNLQGFSRSRFLKTLLPKALRRFGETHAILVDAIVSKNGKRYAKKSNLEEFVARFAEKIENQCWKDVDFRNAR